ncbi:MAG: hypothetical protein ACOY4K_09725 [Pseudomonadota bacterium]
MRAPFMLVRMATTDSALDPEALAYARALLKPPLERDSVWAALAAAAFAAASALAFAVAMVMAPPAAKSRLELETPQPEAEILLPEGESAAQGPAAVGDRRP